MPIDTTIECTTPLPTDPPIDGPGPAKLPGQRDSSETTTQHVARWRPRTTLAMLGALCAICSGVGWLERRSLASTQHTLNAQAAALARMKTDARAVVALRSAPRRATDRRRPNEELLAQIDAALNEAGVPKHLWQDSIPQPPQRLADSPYQRLSTRVYFEDITLRQLVAFAHRLLEADPTLTLSAMRIAAGRTDERPNVPSTTWHAELTISYLIYGLAPGYEPEGLSTQGQSDG